MTDTEHPQARSPLVSFLLDRIHEDEATAKAAIDGPWAVAENGEVYAPRSDREVRYGLSYPDQPARVSVEHLYVTSDSEGLSASVQADDAAHIARHDPARVLADCAARRAIIDTYQQRAANWEYYDEFWGLVEDQWRDVLRLLAQPFHAHPEFDPAWAVDQS